MNLAATFGLPRAGLRPRPRPARELRRAHRLASRLARRRRMEAARADRALNAARRRTREQERELTVQRLLLGNWHQL